MMTVNVEQTSRFQMDVLMSIRSDLFAFVQKLLVDDLETRSSYFSWFQPLSVPKLDLLNVPQSKSANQDEMAKSEDLWGILPLSILSSDEYFMQLLTLASTSHLMRSFPTTLSDLGQITLSPLSIFWAYAGYLTQLLNRNFNAFPNKILLYRNGNTYNDLYSKLLLVARLIEHFEWQSTPGDLILADAIVSTFLSQPEGVEWDWLLPLARLSPISQICHSKNLWKASKENTAFIAQLIRGPGNIGDRPMKGLSVIASAHQFGGLHHRLSQLLADSCQSSNESTVIDLSSNLVDWLAREIHKRLKNTTDRTEADFFASLLVLRAYWLAFHDGNLKNLLHRRESKDLLVAIEKEINPREILDISDETIGRVVGEEWEVILSKEELRNAFPDL